MEKNGGRLDDYFYTGRYVKSSGYTKKDVDIAAIYQQEISRHPLLTKEEEQELGRKIEYAHHGILSALCEYVYQPDNGAEVRGLSFLHEGVKKAGNSQVSAGNRGKNEVDAIRYSIYVALAEGINSSRAVNGDSRSDYYNKVSDYYDKLFELTCYTFRRSLTRDAAKKLLKHLEGRLKNDEDQTLKEFYRELKKDVRVQDKCVEKYINRNLRLVCKNANSEYNKHWKVMNSMSLPDVIQHGNIGLMKAAEKFDFRPGYKFSTYATWWIRQSILRGISADARTVRLPIHVIESFSKYRQSYEIQFKKLGREPTQEEIAEICNSKKSMETYSKFLVNPILLSTPVGNDDSEFIEILADETEPDPYRATEKNRLRETVEKALVTLTPREERILRLRYGLKEDVNHTLKEVGEMFELTKERIRQIQNKALMKLGKRHRRKILEDYGSVKS